MATKINEEQLALSLPMKLRPVEIMGPKRDENGGFANPPEKEPIGVGLFHGWGVDYDSSCDGVGIYTVAIVEHPNGTIETMVPGYIRFTDND